SNSERLDDEPSGRSTRVLLLAGDQVPIPDRVGLEATVDDEVRVFELARLVLDPKGLNPAAHVPVHEPFLGVGEPGPALARNEAPPSKVSRAQKWEGGGTDPARPLPRLKERGDEPVHAMIAEEGVHRPLSTDEQDAVVIVEADVGERL